MPNGSQDQNSGVKKVSKACERCRALKVKCSGTQPCGRCSRGEHQCVFPTGSKRISISESYLRYLESQVRQDVSADADNDATGGSLSVNRNDLAQIPERAVVSVDATSNLGMRNIDSSQNTQSAPDLPVEAIPASEYALDVSNTHLLNSSLGNQASFESHSDPLRVAQNYPIDGDSHPQPSAQRSRRASQESSDGSTFRQNPLADNDYTFAQMAGRLWYMGPSSSWSFCRRVFALLGKRLPESRYHNDPGYLDGGAFRLRWRPVWEDETPDTSNLPPLDFALFLFNTAKFYLGTIFHIIDEKDFIRNMHELYDNPAAKATSSRHWFAQYLLILAYGKAFIVHQSTPEGPSGYQYAARAMALMPDLSGLAPNPIQAVQALVLGSLYLQAIDMRVGCLQHIGHALRICIIEGWHRHMPENVVGKEHSRRCNIVFWVVYMLDREFGPLMGAPSSIRDEDITVKQPSELDDSLEAKNLTLHVRLSRLMAQILTQIYGVGKSFDGTLITNTQGVLRHLAHLSKDINNLLNTHFQGSVNKASRMALRLILGYHHCIVLTTRPLVMCALHMHIKHTDALEIKHVQLSKPVYSLLQSCVDSAQTILRILRVVGDEELLEAFLPFQVEDAFSSAFVLSLIRVMTPSLVQDENWRENIQSVLDKMISKGSVVAPLRKEELSHLEGIMDDLTPRGDALFAPVADDSSIQGGHQRTEELPSMEMEDIGWDLFVADGGMGLSPQQMLNLAAQLGFDQNHQVQAG